MSKTKQQLEQLEAVRSDLEYYRRQYEYLRRLMREYLDNADERQRLQRELRSAVQDRLGT